MAKLAVLCLLTFICACSCMLEQGIYDLNLTDESNLGYFQKVMFNRTHIGLRIQCSSLKNKEAQLKARWMLYWASCADELAAPEVVNTLMENGFDFQGYDNKTHKMYVSKWEHFNCTDDVTTFTLEDKRHEIPDALYDYDDDEDFLYDFYDYESGSGSGLSASSSTEDSAEETENPPPPEKSEDNAAEKTEDTAEEKSEKPAAEKTENAAEEKSDKPAAEETEKSTQKRKKRAAEEKGDKSKDVDEKGKAAKSAMLQPGEGNVDMSHVAVTNHDGPHLFALVILPSVEASAEASAEDKDVDVHFKAEVTVHTKGPRGYLSAMEWPLLPFYGVMSAVYLLYGLAWLVMMFMNWRDLLRVQFWVGGVILIGMLEKAVFFGEYETVNNSGRSLAGAIFFAEVVSSLKRALARVLVIIVSLGFGIVKPRLGPVLHKVVAVGSLYFILGSLEAYFRLEDRQGKEQMFANIPLAVLDAAICWWVFTALVQVMRTLRLRRNVVKLSLYRHFTNTLIFAVLASIVYMAWSIKEHRLKRCLTDWHEIWVDDAFWHILFCIILGVIIILWRPSANNQRFAFSPLIDSGEADVPEDEEKLISDAYDGMKKRNDKSAVRPYRDQPETDKDLQWIDDNIPASVADSALPSLLDSDEEVVTTKYEMSKME